MADGVSQLTIGCHYARSPNIQRFIFVCRDGISIDPSDRRMTQTCSSLFRRVLLLFFFRFYFAFILFHVCCFAFSSRFKVSCINSSSSSSSFASERYRDFRLRLTATPTPERIVRWRFQTSFSLLILHFET